LFFNPASLRMFIRALGLLIQVSLTVFCDDVLEKTKQVAGTRRDEADNGILTTDPFIEAAHFWPFDKSTSVLTNDLVTGANSILMDGAAIKPDDVFTTCLDTTSKKSYAIVGDFNGTCFSDPSDCKLGGMTIYLWLKIKKSDLDPKKDQYIISSGGQSKKSRGFAFLNFHGSYVMVLSTKERQWKITIPKLKLDEWMQLAFVWNNKNNRLTFYLNGELKDKTEGTTASRPENKFTILTIGRPNNAVNQEFMMPLKMAYLTLWDKALSSKEVGNTFKNIKAKIDDSRRRRSYARKQNIPKQPKVDLVL